jgi:hypothetical protein
MLPFFHNRETMTVAIKLRIAGTDLWNQEAIESPGAAFDRGGQDRSVSIAVDGCTCRRAPDRSGETPEMVRTSATRPIVVVPPTQLGIEAVVATENRGVQTAWPHFTAITHSTDVPKPLPLTTSDGACSIRPQPAGEDLTSPTSISRDGQ